MRYELDIPAGVTTEMFWDTMENWDTTDGQPKHALPHVLLLDSWQETARQQLAQLPAADDELPAIPEILTLLDELDPQATTVHDWLMIAGCDLEQLLVWYGDGSKPLQLRENMDESDMTNAAAVLERLYESQLLFALPGVLFRRRPLHEKQQ